MNARDRAYLQDMLDAATEALGYVQGRTRHYYDQNREAVRALTMVVGIIGEAASQLTDETKQTYQDIPWREIIGMRNRMYHGYRVINFDVVWETATQELVPLIARLREILDALPPPDPEAGEADAKEATPRAVSSPPTPARPATTDYPPLPLRTGTPLPPSSGRAPAWLCVSPQ